MSGRKKFLLYAKRTSGKVIYSWWLTGNVYFAISIQPSYKLLLSACYLYPCKMN